MPAGVRGFSIFDDDSGPVLFKQSFTDFERRSVPSTLILRSSPEEGLVQNTVPGKLAGRTISDSEDLKHELYVECRYTSH